MKSIQAIETRFVAWLENMAPLWFSHLGRTVAGEPERLALFEGGVQVDFVFHPCPGLPNPWPPLGLIPPSSANPGIVLVRRSVLCQAASPWGVMVGPERQQLADEARRLIPLAGIKNPDAFTSGFLFFFGVFSGLW